MRAPRSHHRLYRLLLRNPNLVYAVRVGPGPAQSLAVDPLAPEMYCPAHGIASGRGPEANQYTMKIVKVQLAIRYV